MYKLALFDLDNTLIPNDSDWLWGDFLYRHGFTGENFRMNNDAFMESYNAGTLDSREYLRFVLKPMKYQTTDKWKKIREKFLEEKIKPLITDQIVHFIDWHRKQDFTLILITATNSFITEPIAKMLTIDNLIASEIEIIDGKYTGNPLGTPCFQQGKVDKLTEWLKTKNIKLEDVESRFYSDSINDLPLLKKVNLPVAVNPCEQLHAYALKQGWKIVEFWPENTKL